MNAIAPAEAPVYDFTDRISSEEWNAIRCVLDAFAERDIGYVVGGGIAFAAYSERWRTFKDLDLFILQADREKAIAAVTQAGFTDYFEKVPYDPAWIYRCEREGRIVDFIWAMANHSTFVDAQWLNARHHVRMYGRSIPLAPPEELIYSKLYVMQHDRCDWPDLFNILYRQGESVDWRRLLQLVGEDAPLLGAMMRVYAWLCPEPAGKLPGWIWEHVQVNPPPRAPGRRVDRGRIALIDTRDWFGPSGLEKAA